MHEELFAKVSLHELCKHGQFLMYMWLQCKDHPQLLSEACKTVYSLLLTIKQMIALQYLKFFLSPVKILHSQCFSSTTVSIADIVLSLVTVVFIHLKYLHSFMGQSAKD